MNNEQTEISIRIPDLCAAFLKKIKPILALVLVFTLLGALFGAYRATHAGAGVGEEALREAETALVDANNAVAEAEGTLASLLEVEIPQAEATVERAKHTLQQRQAYLDKSLYYALDPMHIGVSRVSLYVETDTEIDPEAPWLASDPQTSIAQAYARMYPFDSELLDHIRQIMNADVDLSYFSEMVTISNDDDPFVAIRVFHKDAEVADEVMDYLLVALQERLTKVFGSYSAHVINRFVGYEVNEIVAERHNEEVDNLYTAQAELFAAEQKLMTLKDNARASAEQAIEDCRSAAAEAEDHLSILQNRYASAKPTPKNILKKAVKFAVLFFVVGFFGACVLVFLGKVFSGKLQDINDVLTRFSFPLIGTLPSKKQRLFEKTIRRLEGEPDLDYETAGKATAQSLFSVVGDRKVALVSSAGPELVQEFLPFVGERIPACGDLLRDAEAVKAAKDFDGFVLVEKRGSSRFDLIDAEARRIRALGKETEGIILL